MIRLFELDDLEWFRPNEWSHTDDFLWCLKDTGYWKYTVDRDGKIMAIVIVHEYHPDCYQACFLIGEEIDMGAVRELRRFLYNSQQKLGAKRLQTDSVDCETLNRWHEFLGMKREGKREKMAYDRDYIMWGKVWA